MTPDVIAQIHLYATEKGGRQGPTRPDALNCFFIIDDKTIDCVLLLSEAGSLKPGQQARVPIKFLDPEYARELVKRGSSFKLRELRIIGEGVILDVLF